MPNSLLGEINGLRSRYHALKLANIKYSDIIVSIGILFILFKVWLVVNVKTLAVIFIIISVIYYLFI
jgi:hypothetical protein